MAKSPSLKQTAYIEGLAELRRLINPPSELMAEPWRDAMDALAAAGQAAAQAAAPRGATGQLRVKIFGRVQRKPMPMWVAIRARAKRKSRKYPRGYPYPRLLEVSAKHGHKGWFTAPLMSAMVGRAEQELAKAGDAIQRRWATGR